MKWRSHLSIGRAIADRLELSPGERKAFLDGMVEPDRHQERVGGPGHSYRISHHRPPRRVIMLHVWMARRSFLCNHSYQGYRHLGMALHYVQDKSTSKGFLGFSHHRRENALAELDVPNMVIEKGLERYTPSPEFVSRSIALVKPKEDPAEAMAQASFRSAAIAAAVLDVSHSPELKRQLHEQRRRHALLHAPLAIASLAIGLSLSVTWSSPYPMLVSFPIIVTTQFLDRPYRRLSRLADWYGLREH